MITSFKISPIWRYIPSYITLSQKLSQKFSLAFTLALGLTLSLWSALSITPALADNPGDLDDSFGLGGIVTTPIGSGDDEIYAIAIQADGKIVVGGRSQATTSSFAVARYNPDGTLDSEFGSSGIVTTTVGSSGGSGLDVAIQADGKILIIGSSSYGMTVVRYKLNGELDSAFGNGGIVAPGGGAVVGYAIAIQSDNKILMVGSTNNIVGPPSDFVLFRYNSDGAPDTEFGTDGKVITSLTTGDYPIAMAIQPVDQKIVVGGTGIDDGFDSYFALARYNSDGSLDSGFGTGGIILTPAGNNSNNFGEAVAIQTDGKIILAGVSHNGIDSDFAAIRYNPDGTLDQDFGSNGLVLTPIGINEDRGMGVTIQTNGKIVVAGRSQVETNPNFSLVRYHNNGSLDSSFGTDGKIITPVSAGFNQAHDIALQPDGKIVAAGGGYNGANSDFVLVRYLGDLPPGIQLVETEGTTGVSESGAVDTYEVVLTGPPTATVTIDLDSDTQLSPSESSLVFTTSDWNITQTVTVNAVDDFIYEGPHTGLITHTITSEDHNYNTMPVPGVTAQIVDNDNLPTLAITDVAVNESSGTAFITVTLTGQSAFPAAASYTIGGGTATGSGVDYSAVNGVFNWPAHQPGNQTVPITIFNDTLDEPDETLLLTLSNPISATITAGSGMLTILDNDAPPNLTLTKAVELSRSPAEPGDPLTYTIAIANSGADIDGVHVTDTLPDYILGADLSQTVTLTAQHSLTFTIHATLAGDVPYGIVITNTASYSHTSGSGQANAVFTVAADITPPTFPSPALITPTGNVRLAAPRPIFDWADALDNQSGVVSYTLVLTNDGDALSLQATTLITTAQSIFTPTVDLPAGTYTWTVRAHDFAGNTSAYLSPAEHFSIETNDNDVNKNYLPIILKSK